MTKPSDRHQLMSQPLPADLPPHLYQSGKIERIRTAYSTLLMIQDVTSSSNIGSKKSREKKLMHIRILGYLIREGPSLTASEFVAEEVHSYEDEDEIDKVGEKYYLFYLRACTSPLQWQASFVFFNSFITVKKFKGHTPSQSSHSSYAEFETKKQMMMEMLGQADEPPKNHREAKKQVRCSVSMVLTFIPTSPLIF
jgi:hypothetical protein